MPSAFVTGSSGLIGSEIVLTLDRLGWAVHGVDNNMRRDFFGPDGDTTANLDRLVGATKHFEHHVLDMRDREGLARLVAEVRPGVVVHCAAQPSHDLAARRPFDDFDVNAMGTLNLLEAARAGCPESPFVFLSTNKVYGDAPNELELVELDTRYDYADPALRRRNRRELPHRRDDPQPLRRVEGGSRPPRAGVRPLLRHADGLLPRRLSHGLEPCERRASRIPRLSRPVHA